MNVEWESLPGAVKDAVQESIGSVTKVEPIHEGKNTALVAVAYTRTGRVFLKGTAESDAGAAARLALEAALAPHVTAISPALVGDVSAGEWRVLAFEWVPGRRADYSADSPDLAKVMTTMQTLDLLQVPQDTVRVPWFEARLSGYAQSHHLHRLTGRALLHTDLNPGNMRVGSHAATLIDWASASRGPAWVNAAGLVLCLIACGHTPKDAEARVAELDSWRDADPEDIDVYARTIAATYLDAFFRHTRPWARAVVQAAQTWAMYRWDAW